MAIIYYTRMEIVAVVVAAQPDKNRLVKGEPFDFEKTIFTAKKGDKIVIKGLHFYTDEARILPTSMAAINDLVAVMKKNPKLRIDIQGHMCCSEDRTNLAGDRAKTIYKILVKSGINKRRMTLKGFGSE
ncbi:MAG: OmpA family protein [Flavobacterium sp.]|nr:MAG: OmpA family protein [Flavobacterium sp.]